MLGLPIACMFGAVVIGRYPVFDRTLVTAFPAVILFTAHGAISVAGLFRARIGLVAAAALSAVLLAYPVKTAVEAIGTPQRNNEAIEPLLGVLIGEWQPNDTLYVHYGAQYAFRYYAECRCLDGGAPQPPLSLATRRTTGPRLWHAALRSQPPRLYIGTRNTPDDPRPLLREVDRLRGRPRVWVLSSFLGSPEEARLLTVLLPAHLDRLGTRQSGRVEGNARLLLYDLSGRR